jgi:hypothetical protein
MAAMVIRTENQDRPVAIADRPVEIIPAERVVEQPESVPQPKVILVHTPQVPPPPVPRASEAQSNARETVMITIIFALMLISVTILNIVKARMKNPDRNHSTEDTQLIQEIHRSLMSMERRIEALETLWMDKAHEDNFDREVYRGGR